MKVKVRFAPSPTGFLHIGGVRTVLYNYLFARRQRGVFVLRIEDTDKIRLVPGAAEDITESLEWLGLKFDDDPIYQSKRLKIYQKQAQELLDKDLAYREDKAIKFKTTKEGQTSWADLVGNKIINFDNGTQDDFVIIKSDDYPTYNFANVVDDHLMEITHVIRGAEFISSTPKHLMLYQAFGWEHPQFAHLPLILGSDRSKLSKRHGAKAVSEFKKEGFLPEAILNYMSLLGWTPPAEKEILSLDEMIEVFDLSDVHLSNPVFDPQKLEWMNGVYIRKMTDEQLLKRLQEFLVDHPAKKKIAPLIPLIKERIRKLSDFVPLTAFFFEEPDYDKGLFEKLLAGKNFDPYTAMTRVVEVAKGLPVVWKAEDFEKSYKDLAEKLKFPPADVFQLVRLGVSGQLVTPPLFDSIKILGEKEAVRRLEEAAHFLK